MHFLLPERRGWVRFLMRLHTTTPYVSCSLWQRHIFLFLASSPELSECVVSPPQFCFCCGCFIEPIHFVLLSACVSILSPRVYLYVGVVWVRVCFGLYGYWLIALIYLAVSSLVVRCPCGELVTFWFSGLAASFAGLAFQVIEAYQAMYAVYV